MLKFSVHIGTYFNKICICSGKNLSDLRGVHCKIYDVKLQNAANGLAKGFLSNKYLPPQKKFNIIKLKKTKSKKSRKT